MRFSDILYHMKKIIARLLAEKYRRSFKNEKSVCSGLKH